MDLPNEPVIDLTVVAVDAMELIVVQTRSNDDFTQSFYRSNGSAFDKVYHIEASNRTSISPAPCTIQGHGCILIHTYQNATSFDILHVNASHEVPADLQMTKLGIQDVGEMKQLIAGNGRVLVILGIDEVLTILDYDLQPIKIERSIGDASEVAARTFEQMVYIAVSTITENSAHAIEIYRQVVCKPLVNNLGSNKLIFFLHLLADTQRADLSRCRRWKLADQSFSVVLRISPTTNSF